VHLGNDCHVGTAFGGLHGGPHSGEPPANDYDIVLDQAISAPIGL
jgi:hypothetical protein